MDIKQLIQVSAILAGLAVASGHFPQILHSVQIAQLKLIKASQSSTWGRAMILPVAK